MHDSCQTTDDRNGDAVELEHGLESMFFFFYGKATENLRTNSDAETMYFPCWTTSVTTVTLLEPGHPEHLAQ